MIKLKWFQHGSNSSSFIILTLDSIQTSQSISISNPFNPQNILQREIRIRLRHQNHFRSVPFLVIFGQASFPINEDQNTGCGERKWRKPVCFRLPPLQLVKKSFSWGIRGLFAQLWEVLMISWRGHLAFVRHRGWCHQLVGVADYAVGRLGRIF